MSDPSDGETTPDEAPATAAAPVKDPPAATAAEPPARPSSLQLSAKPPAAHPDDGPFSRFVRKIDSYVGLAEQATLFGILVLVVLVASIHAIMEKATHSGLWFSEDVIRGGTFAIATIGAAFATQQQRHLAMDLLSRKLSPRNRLVLAAAIELFMILMCFLLVRSGIHQISATSNWTGRHLFHVSTIVQFLPIGAALIIFHAVLHLVIDIDYLVRGKVAAEKMRVH